MSKKRVVIGMSGGVDSSVAAKLLLDGGFDVVGLFMHNWEESEEGGACSSALDWEDARAVCGRLGIPCYSVNFARDYMERVFSYFLDEYKKGRTPNPDVLCNREIKFGPFRAYAEKLGADYIATGHYCGISHEQDNTPMLLTARDASKDQTYFLNQVRTEQLQKVIFPLSRLLKTEVRAIAEAEDLVTARKKDSTGICFIGERKFREFLKTYLPAQKGDIVDKSGRVLGTHEGLMYYTLGQRKGFGLGGVAGEDANRWYVVAKDLTKNRLLVSNGEGEELFTTELTTRSLNFIGPFDPGREFRAMAKCRYRQEEQPCTVRYSQKSTPKNARDGGTISVLFDTPQRAVTPGQYVVLYQDNRCLGGGVIE